MDRALRQGDGTAEMFTLPTEQFLILPEGRLSPAMPWLLGRGELLLWERLAMLLQSDPLKNASFMVFF